MNHKKQSLAAAVKVALALNAGAVVGGMPLLTQAEEDTIAEVIVTGSRIPRNDLNGPSPCRSMTAVQLLEAALLLSGNFCGRLQQLLVKAKQLL